MPTLFNPKQGPAHLQPELATLASMFLVSGLKMADVQLGVDGTDYILWVEVDAHGALLGGFGYRDCSSPRHAHRSGVSGFTFFGKPNEQTAVREALRSAFHGEEPGDTFIRFMQVR